MGKFETNGHHNRFLRDVDVKDTYERKGTKEMRVIKEFTANSLGQSLLPQIISETGKQQAFDFFKESFIIRDSFLKSWDVKKTSSCDGKFKGYAHLFVRWENMTIDPSKSSCAYGGENITEVLKRRESSELLNPRPGFFEVNCRSRPRYDFARYLTNRGHLPSWLRMVKMTKPVIKNKNIINNFTIVVQRYEYANMYHSMNDIFNMFLLHIFFHKDPSKTTIIFADGHPKGHIDPLWENLFGRVIRVRHLKTKTTFRELIWAMLEKFCPLNLFDLKKVEYIDYFRSFVLGTYGIQVREAPNCVKTKVLFLWRHDYLSHPRNPKEKIMRKISNEQELFNTTKNAFPQLNFMAVDLATITIKEQLRIIAETDIIIAMHGAGLTLELFLPPNGGVIELLPYDPKMASRKQYDLFKVIASRIPLHHKHWQNKDKENEVSFGNTYIPPKIVHSLLEDHVQKVCPELEM